MGYAEAIAISVGAYSLAWVLVSMFKSSRESYVTQDPPFKCVSQWPAGAHAYPPAQWITTTTHEAPIGKKRSRSWRRKHRRG